MLVRPRRFALALIGLAAGLFAAVAVANIAIDPQEVFGTGLISIHQNANHRVLAFRNYRRMTQATEGLLFSSSRGFAFPIAELSARAQADITSFAVDFGLITDHLPVLDYVIRDKAARGGRLRFVFLMLDIDFLGQRSLTNRTIQTYLPPAVSGEGSARFWLRYLTAIQFRSWRNEIKQARGQVDAENERPPVDAIPRIRLASADPGAVPVGAKLTRVTEQPEYASQLVLVKQFIALCRAHDIRLIIATSPLHRDIAGQYDAADMAAARDALAALAPIWDFDAPGWLSDHEELWINHGHFSGEVAHMMIDRIFSGRLPAGGQAFGELRSDPPRP